MGVFAQAGRGLAAAHQEGVIHRDFKPANVLLDGRGRALVLDFGLARGVGDPEEAAETQTSGKVEDSSPGASASASMGGRTNLLTAQLTRHGAVMGTPRFMSPEQHTTSVVDARSDQYSFCMALYGAVYGAYPFAAEEAEGHRKLFDAKRAAKIRWDDPKVPEHIQAVLRRGLAVRRDDRWPDMDSLIDALEDDPSARRRKRLIGGAAVLALAATVGAGLGWDARVRTRCEDQRTWLDDAWGETQRGAMASAFAAVDQPYASSALDHANVELDRYTTQLGQARAQLCLDRHESELEAEVVEARGACLDAHHRQLRVVVERLAEADATMVERTVDVLSALPAIETCSSLSEYAVAASDPEAGHAIEEDLFAARLLAAAGREPDALAEIDGVIERARTLDDPHVLTLVLTRAGELYGAARKLEQAEALASEAVLLAEQHGEHDLAIDALIALSKTLSNLRGRWDDAQRVLDIARAKHAREPGGSRGEWYHHYIQASIHMQHHRFDECIAEHQLATEQVRTQGSAMDLAKALQAHAGPLIIAERGDEAEALLRESIELRTGLYGLDHPNLMYPYRGLARLAASRDEHEQALEHLARVVELGERHHGPDAGGLVEPHNERAKSLRGLGRYEEALVEYEAVLHLRRVNDMPLDEELRLMSQVRLRLDQPEQALELAEQALAAHRNNLGPDEQVPWLRARFVMHRGEALLALGRYDEALIDFERGAELRAAEKEDSLLVRIWVGEGYCRLGLGDLDGAREAFERALEHREAGNGVDDRTDGELEFGLAKVAVDASTRQQRAEAAIAAFEAHGGDDDLADEVRAWLAGVE